MSFVARGYSAKPKDLAVLIEQGIKHKGFSFIQVLSPCPTFYNTFDAWDEAITPISEEHNRSNKGEAFNLAMETEKQFTGIFYEEERLTMDQAAQQLVQEPKEFNIEQYMQRYA